MDKTLKALQEKIISQNINDYQILELSRDDGLTIIGSFDFGYYHNVEIYFKGVKYISCPTYFSYATFRLATDDECLSIKEKLTDGQNDRIFCIALDEDMPESSIKHFIVAEDIQYKFEMVYYYKREKLKDNERIADWIK